MLSEWYKKENDNEYITIGEIQDFWTKHSKICWNNQFINKVICPQIATDLENGGFEGLKFLFHCFCGHEDSYLNTNSPLANLFDRYSNSSISLSIAGKSVILAPFMPFNMPIGIS